MIWTTNAAGENTYVSPELVAFTGREESELRGSGWLCAVHQDDQALTRSILFEATRRQASFSVQFRMLLGNGSFAWVAAGAAPSFGPPDRIFLGYLGSLTMVGSTESEELEATGEVGCFDPPAPHPMTCPATENELIADHLLIARSRSELAGYVEMVKSIDLALLLIGRRLALDSAPVH